MLAGIGGLASVGVGAGLLRVLASSGMENIPNAAHVQMDWTVVVVTVAASGAGRGADWTGAGGNRGKSQPQPGARRRQPARNRRTRHARVPTWARDHTGRGFGRASHRRRPVVDEFSQSAGRRRRLRRHAGHHGDDFPAAVALQGSIGCGRLVESRPGIGSQHSRRPGGRHHVEHCIERPHQPGDCLGRGPPAATRRSPGASIRDRRHSRIFRSDGDASRSRAVLHRRGPRTARFVSRLSTSASQPVSGRVRIRSGRVCMRGDSEAVHGRGCGSRRAVRESRRANRALRRRLLPARAGAAARPAPVDRHQDSGRVRRRHPSGAIGVDGDRSGPASVRHPDDEPTHVTFAGAPKTRHGSRQRVRMSLRSSFRSSASTVCWRTWSPRGDGRSASASRWEAPCAASSSSSSRKDWRWLPVALMLGLLGSIALGRALEGQVFGVRPTDPLVLGLVVALTAIIALLACVSPAYRATRVDPLSTLSEQYSNARRSVAAGSVQEGPQKVDRRHRSGDRKDGDQDLEDLEVLLPSRFPAYLGQLQIGDVRPERLVQVQVGAWRGLLFSLGTHSTGATNRYPRRGTVWM